MLSATSRGRIFIALALATIALCAFQVANAARVKPSGPPDQIGLGLELYRGLVNDLPPTGEIGFLPTSGNTTFDSANHFVAQYALAPRLVVHPFENVKFVITGVDPPPNVEQDPRLRGYQLAGIRGRGIRIFRSIAP